MEMALIAVVMFVALFLLLKTFLKEDEIHGYVNNRDSRAQHYSFELSGSKNDAIAQLSVCNVADVMKYTFDAGSLHIKFEDLHIWVDHSLTFYDVGDVTYLKVTRVDHLFGRDNIRPLINRFFIEKIAARPIEYLAFEEKIRTLAN